MYICFDSCLHVCTLGMSGGKTVDRQSANGNSNYYDFGSKVMPTSMQNYDLSTEYVSLEITITFI